MCFTAVLPKIFINGGTGHRPGTFCMQCICFTTGLSPLMHLSQRSSEGSELDQYLEQEDSQFIPQVLGYQIMRLFGSNKAFIWGIEASILGRRFFLVFELVILDWTGGIMQGCVRLKC